MNSINKKKVDEYITVALANLNYSDDDIKKITLEVDRVLYEVNARKISSQALKINKKVFYELYG